MKPDNDSIRRVVANLDQDLPMLRIFAAQESDDYERLKLMLAEDAGQQFRGRLKSLGHGSYLDTPYITEVLPDES